MGSFSLKQDVYCNKLTVLQAQFGLKKTKWLKNMIY